MFSVGECPNTCDTWNNTEDAGCQLASRLSTAIQSLAAIVSNMNGVGVGLHRLLSTVGSIVTHPLSIISNIRNLFYGLKTLVYSFSGLAVNLRNILADLTGLLRDLLHYIESEGL